MNYATSSERSELFLLGACAVNTTSQSFAVACPYCGVGLKVAVSDLGQQRNCPQCKSQFRLPSRQQAAAAAKAKREAVSQFGFPCRLCGSQLYARPEQVGNPIKCPDCHAVNHVSPPPEKKAAKVLDAGQAYELALADDNEPSAPGAAEEFTFRCRVCDTMIGAKRNAVGKHIACPDCSTVTVVPKPPPPKKQVVVEADDPGIAVSAAAPRSKQEEVNVDQLMSAAREKIAERERERPKPPQRPFLSGVFTFPFQLLSLPYLIVFTFLICLISILLDLTLELQGLEMIFGIALMVLAAILGIILVGLSCNYFMRVINWTAMGYPNVQESPQFEMFEFVRQALFVINAFGAGAVPGVLLGMATHNATVGFIAIMSSAFIFFPFIILSFVDAESPVTPYSSFIMSTLRLVPAAWLKFYVLAAIAASMAVAAHGLSVMRSQGALPAAGPDLVPPAALEYFSVAVTVAALMIYFRLLGRLAYVIDQTILADAKQQASPA